MSQWNCVIKHRMKCLCRYLQRTMSDRLVGGGGGSYTFLPSADGFDLSVASIETSKDRIEQPPLAEHDNMYIPPIGSSVVISGKSGSGKSTLLANLLTDGRFYGPSEQRPNGWFDKIFLFSPTANGDDIQRSLNIPKKYVFTDLTDAPALLDTILDSQQKKLDDGEGADKVEQYCIIFDDVIGDTRFMNEKAFTRCFYQVRHVNCTTFICTQHFKKVPKICRLQANFVFFFQGSAAEVEMVTEEFAPPMYSRNEFRSLVSDASNKRFSFLTINMKVGWDKRFRRNLDEFVQLGRLIGDEDEPSGGGGTKKDCAHQDKGVPAETKAFNEFEQKVTTVCKHIPTYQDGTDEHAERLGGGRPFAGSGKRPSQAGVRPNW
jgi:hypothetical protein